MCHDLKSVVVMEKNLRKIVCVCTTESLSISLKPTQHCKLIILQFKNIKELGDTRRAYAKELSEANAHHEEKREDPSKQNKK